MATLIDSANRDDLLITFFCECLGSTINEIDFLQTQLAKKYSELCDWTDNIYTLNEHIIKSNNKDLIEQMSQIIAIGRWLTFRSVLRGY
jgi:hypothetical protein